METPELCVEDKVELCDGHSDYGYSILYCKDAGEWKEIYRTNYETNRMNEQTDGIYSFNLERAGDEWVVTVNLASGKATLSSKDGKNWH